jgi:moderate conductance mechanosensitive channel
VRPARPLIITLVLAIVFATSVAIARAQSLPGLPSASASPGQLAPGVRIDGAFRTAPIWLDGVPLFRIATPVTVAPNQTSVEARVQLVESALAQLVATKSSDPNSGTIYDPGTLKVDVHPEGTLAVLEATDKKHPTPLPILTVTNDDARYQRMPENALSQQWQTTLQTALVQALDKRQPGTLQRNLQLLWKVGLVFVAITAVLVIVIRRVGDRETVLARQVEANEQSIGSAPDAPTAGDGASARQRMRFMGLAIRAADPAMSLTLWRALRGLLTWAVVLLWFGGIISALALFPQTTPLGEIIYHRASRIAFTWIGAALLMRVVAIGVTQAARIYGGRHHGVFGEEHARRMLRVPTIANTTIGFATFVIVFAAILATLSLLGISTASVLTIGGLVALAASLAAQNLIRDFLNGFLVLLEDQYVVGDYVIIGDRSGLVEHMTLRIVQLRDSSGNLATIPHSQANEVVNCSRNWSRVDYRIAIDPSADVSKAIDTLRATIRGLAEEKNWKSALVDPVEWVGVDAVSTAGIVLRASIKTAPLRQFEVRRELNDRVVVAFRKADIAFGSKDAYGV